MKLSKTLVICTLALIADGVLAGDKELVDYRQNVMHVIGGHMGAIVAIVKGEVPYNDDLAYHADALAAAAPLAVPVFKQQAMTDKSHALPAIWEDWDAFESAAKTLEETSTAFAAAVAGGDRGAIGGALGKLGDSCKSCHDDFTEEEH